MNVTYCGILNETWTIARVIYFLNFIILGEATLNNELKAHGNLSTIRKICYFVFQVERLFVFVKFRQLVCQKID
jgi:hypothetical protein